MHSAEDTSFPAISRSFAVLNHQGVHARPAAMMVRLANKFNDTDIWVKKDDTQANGKSIMGLMMLAAGHGTRLEFIAKGPEAEEFLNEMEDLFARKFEEA